ncbi:MAG: hypothetical protein JXR83_06625, partial [Deltaproteobacteria bacterium]|nr:hypothetical protein [Deltaproteobacteria bacterium]
QRRGELPPLGEVETVLEIRRLIAGLGDLRSQIESDHVMNLLMDLRGNLPSDQRRLLDQCDAFLGLPRDRQQAFVLGRRLGWLSAVDQLADLEEELKALLDRIETSGTETETVFSELRGRHI